jgi:hypothetical protein
VMETRIVLLSCIFSVSIVTAAKCPDQCTCSDGIKDIYCHVNQQLKPRPFPSQVQQLEVHFRKTTPLIDIASETFADLNQLKILKIKGVVGKVYPRAFTNLSTPLQTDDTSQALHLTSVFICELSKEAFIDVRNFGSLKFTSTWMGSVMTRAFQRIKNIGEISMWNVNITHISSLAFQLADVGTVYTKSVNIQHLSNGAFYGSRRVGHLDVWNTNMACMGQQSFVGIDKLWSAAFTSTVMPHTPLLSDSTACNNLQGFVCTNRSLNVSLMDDDYQVSCQPIPEDEFTFHLDLSEHLSLSLEFIQTIKHQNDSDSLFS